MNTTAWKRTLVVAAVLAGGASHGHGQEQVAQEVPGPDLGARVTGAPVRIAEDLELSPLLADVWVHRSSSVLDGSPVWANGLVIVGEWGLVLIDTPWNDRQTAALLEHVETTLERPVVAAVVSHTHPDAMGGIRALRERGIPVHGNARSAQLAADSTSPPPDELFDIAAEVELAGVSLQLFWPGHGHAPDNIVVYQPDRQLLFGGCFVKSYDARGMGFVGDADLVEWRRALQGVAERYPRIRTLVPGHGQPGDRGLLTHTRVMIATHR